MATVTKTWKKEEIKALLETNDEAVIRGLVRIYERQTFAEQASHATKESNGKGFTAFDAEILTSFAEQIIKWQNGDGQYASPLSFKQFKLAKKRMMKYAGQLAKIANGE